MRRWWLIFGFLLLLCLVLGAALSRPNPEGKHGLAHPRIGSMQVGGDAARHDGAVWLGWLYGTLQIGLFATTLTLGLRKRRVGLGAIAAIGMALVGGFTAVIVSYAMNQSHASPGLWFGFPPSTAVMLFVLWPLPSLFIIIYITMFDRWFLAPEDLERFAKLVERGESSEEEV